MYLFTEKSLMITGVRGSFGNVVFNPFLRTDIGDVRDIQSCKNAIRGVECIFHVASPNQVSYCDSFSMEVVKTNVKGIAYGRK